MGLDQPSKRTHASIAVARSSTKECVMDERLYILCTPPQLMHSKDIYLPNDLPLRL